MTDHLSSGRFSTSHSPVWLTVVMNMSLPLPESSSLHWYWPGNPTTVSVFSCTPSLPRLLASRSWESHVSTRQYHLHVELRVPSSVMDCLSPSSESIRYRYFLLVSSDCRSCYEKVASIRVSTVLGLLHKVGSLKSAAERLTLVRMRQYHLHVKYYLVLSVNLLRPLLYLE